MIAFFLASFALAATPAADRHDQRPIGKETTIPFASRHGLRDWEAGPTDDVLYVQDYRRDWYQVELSGPCIDNVGSLRIAYTTSPTGSFDRFSKVYSTDFPNRTCGVIGIKTSLAPPDRRPDAKRDKSK